MSKLREDCPIYMNPSFDELVELCSVSWDTLRILDGDKIFIIGSGYGNTHTTLADFYAINNNFKRVETPLGTRYKGRWPSWDPFIVFKKANKMLVNCEDVSGEQYTKLSKVPMTDEHLQILKDIAALSELEYE